ncbi:pyridoxal phosphate-dependent decarboxylase family protein [Neolewinella aurantiaca]|nr:pyridoxal-dependent decarboxylase [Neolewinella aurantiaca]
MKSLHDLYDSENFRTVGHALIDQLADYLADADGRDANPQHEPETMLDDYRNILAGALNPNKFFGHHIEHSLHLHSPRYMGHQVNPPAPLTALADLANGIINGSTAVFEMGSTGAVMERLVIEKFVELLELDDSSGGFLTNGGTLANLTALLAARAAKWPAGDAWSNGNGNIRPCILVNEEAHYCVDRAVRIMGWGTAGIVNIPADENFRMRTDLIDEAVLKAEAEGLTPLAIVGSACTTSTGSFDDLSAIADAATRHNLWFHVDGAHGAPVRLDPARKHLLDGLEKADSLVMDFHKMLMCPGLTTGLFFRKGSDAYRTFHQKADYLLSFDTSEEDWYNMGRRTFECTKNMMSLRVFSLLSCAGTSVFRDYVVRVNETAQVFATAVRSNPDFELALEPDCNIVCFRFRPTRVAHSAEELNHLNTMLRSQLVSETKFYIVQTKLRGNAYLRCTFTNPLTEEVHCNELLAELTRLGTGLTDFRTQFI